MGLLFDILTLPVSGPMKGLVFIARHIQKQADGELAPLDPQALLLEVEMLYELGQIGEEDYVRRQDELLELLAVQQEELTQENDSHGD
jgi:hypothetical protein